jgi:hypothetical protein
MIKSHRLRRVTTTLVAIVATLCLSVGIYHLTHQGLHSGVTEIGLSVFLCYLTFRVYRSGVSTAKSGWFHRALSVTIGIISGVFLFLSIYHFTHQGLPSGIVELGMASLLATTLYLMLMYQD